MDLTGLMEVVIIAEIITNAKMKVVVKLVEMSGLYDLVCHCILS